MFVSSAGKSLDSGAEARLELLLQPRACAGSFEVVQTAFAALDVLLDLARRVSETAQRRLVAAEEQSTYRPTTASATPARIP
jgi:hypothetical protein